MTIELSTLDAALLRLTYLKCVEAVLRHANREARDVADELLRRGDTLAVRSPLDGDIKMARVSKSDPKPVATVTDPVALDRWIREQYPEKLKTETTIVGTDGEVVTVLREHAPHLVATATVVPGWAVNELCTRSAGAGQPVGFGGEIGDDGPPGITVTRPDGVLSVTVDKIHGQAEIRRLWELHMFGMDGEIMQLPSGDQAA